MGFPLSVLCSWSDMGMDKQNLIVLSRYTRFLWVIQIWRKDISAFQGHLRPLNRYHFWPLLNPLYYTFKLWIWKLHKKCYIYYSVVQLQNVFMHLYNSSFMICRVYICTHRRSVNYKLDCKYISSIDKCWARYESGSSSSEKRKHNTWNNSTISTITATCVHVNSIRFCTWCEKIRPAHMYSTPKNIKSHAEKWNKVVFIKLPKVYINVGRLGYFLLSDDLRKQTFR
jgi:hypothetical protein